MSVTTSQKVHPDSYRNYLQVWFLYHLTQSQEFLKVVRNLKPLWSKVLTASYDPSALAALPYIHLPAKGSSEMIIYKTLLEKLVTADLHCCQRQSGNAPDWICLAVHSFVSDNDTHIRMNQDERMHRGDLTVLIPNGGRATLSLKIDGQEVTERIYVDVTKDSFFSPSLTAFSDWGELRRVAHAKLDDFLEKLRSTAEMDTQDWRQIRRGGHETRVIETMPLVVAWLTKDVKLRGSDRANGYSLIRDLDLDKPKTMQSVKKHRRK